MTIPNYYQLPDIPDAGLLTRYLSTMGVIVPLARTNLVSNPVLKLNTTGWTALNVDSSFSSGIPGPYFYDGFGALIQPLNPNVQFGIYYTISLVSGTTYAISIMFRRTQAERDGTYALAVATTGGVDLAVSRFRATDKWQWVTLIWTETSTTSRRIIIRRDDLGGVAVGSAADIFRISGLQVEACSDGILEPTTYIDGDQKGLVPNQYPPAYGWNGAPHQSTSYRSGQTRAGGRIMRFRDFGFLLTAIIGLGLAPPTQEALTFAQLDGGQYQNTIKGPRSFSLAGRWAAASPIELESGQAQLGRLLDRDLVGLRQPLVLTTQAFDSYPADGEPVTIPAIYSGGLEGRVNNLPSAAGQITFTQYVPYVIGPNPGANLIEQSSVSNANFIAQRGADGVWAALGTGAAGGAVFAVAYAPDGSIYAGGAFTSMGGVANTPRIARWTGTAWQALGTGGAGGNVYALAIGADGSVYAAGDFTSMGGVANTARIARWTGSAWQALGTGANGTVLALTAAPNGNIIAGGNFTLMGGVANTVRIARWNGSAWSALGTGMNVQVASLTSDAAGNIYAGGDFTTAGGNAANRIARWNGSAWSALGTGMDAGVLALEIGLNGLVYAGGDFTSAGSVNASRVAVWNGANWAPLGAGVSSPNSVTALSLRPDGILVVGGTFTTAGGYTVPDGIAYWNGATWLYADVDLPSTAAVLALATSPSGAMVVGFAQSGTAIAAGITSPVINVGTAAAYPRLTITGPSSGSSRIYQIINVTTDAAIYLNYTIVAGETAVLIFTPTNITFVSSYQGNIISTILPGSDTSQFFLQPGDNVISFFSADSTVAAVLDWQVALNDISDALYRSFA